MSISNILKSLAVITFGGLFGYGSIHFLKPEPKNRFIASQPMAKIGLEQNARSLFDVKLNTEDLAKKDSDVSTIQVTIEALHPIDSGLVYHWNLSNDIQVVEGSLHDHLGAFTTGESKVYTLKVKGFSKELKKYISFEVRGDVNQRPVRREVLISSRVEDSFEYMIQQNDKKNTANGQNNKLDKKKNKFTAENVVR